MLLVRGCCTGGRVVANSNWGWQLSAVRATIITWGREPWSSLYGWRLTFERSWVRIPVLYTGWTFLILISCNKQLCLKRPKINEKRPGLAHLKNNNNLISVLNKMEEGVYSDNLMEYMGWQSIKSSPVLAVS